MAREESNREKGAALAIGDFQASVSNAHRDAIDLEVDAYLKRRVIPKLIETVQPKIVAFCREEHPIERVLRDAEAKMVDAGVEVQDYRRHYQLALDMFRDGFRKGLDRASIEFHISMP